jgi:hypothetical protein
VSKIDVTDQINVTQKERLGGGCLSGTFGGLIILALTIIVAVLSTKIELLARVLGFVAADVGSYTVRTMILFSGIFLLILTFFSTLRVFSEFFGDASDGKASSFDKKIEFESNLSRSKTGYAGALIANYTLKITIFALTTTLIINTYNYIDRNPRSDIGDVVKLLSVIAIFFNVAIALIYAKLVSAIIERIIDDVRREGPNQ